MSERNEIMDDSTDRVVPIPQERHIRSVYGECAICGDSLTNWGAASHGDGDMFDEIGCDTCHMRVAEFHAEYCRCEDCINGYSKWHTIEEDADPYCVPSLNM